MTTKGNIDITFVFYLCMLSCNGTVNCKIDDVMKESLDNNYYGVIMYFHLREIIWVQFE